MRHLMTLLILFFVLSGFGQDSRKEIEKEAQAYYQYMKEMNFDGVLDYMYPKIFELTSKDQIKAGMQQMIDSKEMKIEFISNDIKSISDIKKEADIMYALVHFNSKMKMLFLSEKDKTKEEQKAFLGFMQSTLSKQFGEGNVSIDEALLALIVSSNSSMYAIKDPKYNGWKFLGNEMGMEALVDSVVPEQVRTALLKD